MYGVSSTFRVKVFFVALLLAVFSLCGLDASDACAENHDVGEIAIIEDSDGRLSDMLTAGMPNVWLSVVTCSFYLTHPDIYDAVFVFTTGGMLNAITNVQQGWPVHSPSQGIGRGWASQGDSFCSFSHKLRQAVKMSEVAQLPDNPDDQAQIPPIYGLYPLTGSELMAHEFGHQWLVGIDFDLGNDQGRQCLLRGYEPTGSDDQFPPQEGDDNYCNGGNANDFNQHWSYYFNSGSVMYGSMLEELPGENLFRLFYENPKYSEFDQYLMGLRLPEEVNDSFVVYTGDVAGTSSIPLKPGTSAEVEGEKIVVGVDDIIRYMGPREPALEECHWKAAFIIVHKLGMPPSDFEIGKVDAYRQRWESYYNTATDGRGSFDTTLDGCGTGTETCPGEVSEFCGASDCEEGATRCLSTSLIEICHEGEWVMDIECMAPEVCIEGVCVAKPVDGDEDGDVTVDGDEIADGDDAPQVDGDETKPDGDYVGPDGDDSQLPDESQNPVCSPGDSYCQGDTHFKCSASGVGWLSEDCSLSDQTCDEIRGCVNSGAGVDNGGGCASTGEATSAFMLMLALVIVLRRKSEFRG